MSRAMRDIEDPGERPEDRGDSQSSGPTSTERRWKGVQASAVAYDPGTSCQLVMMSVLTLSIMVAWR
jgi:hypothetical protein